MKIRAYQKRIEMSEKTRSLAMRLNALKALPYGWNDGAGEPVTQAALKTAKAAFRALPVMEDFVSIHPTEAGGLCIEPDNGECDTVEIGSDGALTLTSARQGTTKEYPEVVDDSDALTKVLMTFQKSWYDAQYKATLAEQLKDADKEQLERLTRIVNGLLPYVRLPVVSKHIQTLIRREIPSMRQQADKPVEVDVDSYFYVQGEIVAGFGSSDGKPAIMMRVTQDMAGFEFLVAIVPAALMAKYKGGEIDLRGVLLSFDALLYTSNGPYEEQDRSGPAIATPFNGVLHEYLLCSPGLFASDLRQD
jgi:hypothetical protein